MKKKQITEVYEKILGALEEVQALSRGFLGETGMPYSYREVKANCLEVGALLRAQMFRHSFKCSIKLSKHSWQRGLRTSPPTSLTGTIQLRENRRKPACPGLPGTY